MADGDKSGGASPEPAARECAGRWGLEIDVQATEGYVDRAAQKAAESSRASLEDIRVLMDTPKRWQVKVDIKLVTKLN